VSIEAVRGSKVRGREDGEDHPTWADGIGDQSMSHLIELLTSERGLIHLRKRVHASLD
jgi:hypothetical protein